MVLLRLLLLGNAVEDPPNLLPLPPLPIRWILLATRPPELAQSLPQVQFIRVHPSPMSRLLPERWNCNPLRLLSVAANNLPENVI